MTRPQSPTVARRSATALVLVACLAPAGCGGVVGAPTASQALDSGAALSRDAVNASRQLMHRLCPAADDNGVHLTPAQATACVKRATKAYLDFLKARGFDPVKVANGTQ